MNTFLFLFAEVLFVKERKWLIIKAEEESFKFITTCSLGKFDLLPTFTVPDRRDWNLKHPLRSLPKTGILVNQKKKEKKSNEMSDDLSPGVLQRVHLTIHLGCFF